MTNPVRPAELMSHPPRREWMTRTMVADHLGVSLRTVDTWTKDRGLPAHKRGNAVRFDRAEVDDWFRAGNVG